MLLLVGITCFVIGTVIGSGIFITANKMLINVGSWALALIVWAASGLFALAGALCWAELSTILPKQGGTYIFIKEGLSECLSFIYIVLRVFLLNPCSDAIISLACSKYLLGNQS